jgi:amino-acid N-acetyltransferase
LLRPARPSDRPAVDRLLSDAELPLAGLDDPNIKLWVAVEDGSVVGAIGYEVHGRSGLLRSLIVDPRQRGKGLGKRLIHHGLRQMKKEGVSAAYGLTTTIPDLLAKLGWQEVPRPRLPTELSASQELQGACPDSARAFRVLLAA